MFFAMPVQLQPYLHQTNYDYLMGMSGIACGVIVWILWSKGV